MTGPLPLKTPTSGGARVIPIRRETPREATFAEQVLLSASLAYPGSFLALDFVRPEHFFLAANRYIWEAMTTLAAAWGAAPPESWLTDVARELQRAGRLVDVGGVAALADLVDRLPEMGSVIPYGEDVLKAWQARELERVAQRMAAESRADTCPDELIQQTTTHLQALQALGRPQGAPGASLGVIASEAIERYEAPPASVVVRRIRTGIEAIDSYSNGGARPGDLWLLGGRPGAGKTALAVNIATNVAWDDEGALIFSLEMPRDQIADRILSSESGVTVGPGPYDDGQLEALRDARDRVSKLRLWVDDTPYISLEEIVRRSKAYAAKVRAKGKRLGVVVVDYLQIVKVAHRPGRKRVEEIAEVSTTLKALARELDCLVLALAQLNRDSERETRAPRLSDFRDCGQLEQDADWAGFLWRRPNEPSWVVDLAVRKQRMGEMQGDLKLRWEGHLTRFSDG